MILTPISKCYLLHRCLRLVKEKRKLFQLTRIVLLARCSSVGIPWSLSSEILSDRSATWTIFSNWCMVNLGTEEPWPLDSSPLTYILLLSFLCCQSAFIIKTQLLESVDDLLWFHLDFKLVKAWLFQWFIDSLYNVG